MNDGQSNPSPDKEPERRRDWLLLIALILAGILSMCAAGQYALRLLPVWNVPADMGSLLNPDSTIAAFPTGEVIEPVSQEILTPFSFAYLTPGYRSPPPPATKTKTATRPPLPSPTATRSPTNTRLPLFILPTSTSLPTRLPSRTSSPTATFTPTGTFTPTFTSTPTETFTPTYTSTSTETFTPTSSDTPTETPTPSYTPTPSDTPTPTNTPINNVDLQIDMTDSGVSYIPNGILIYTVIVTNSSAVLVNNVPVAVTLPAEIVTANWTCSAAGGATCTPGGTGGVNDTVDLPAGTSVTYVVTADVPLVSNPLNAAASVSTPAGFNETDPLNNADTVSTTVLPSDITIGPGDGSSPYLNPGSGNSIYMVFSPAIANNFVFYERYSDPPANTEIAMDMVWIQISDDGINNWYTVFYWGDGNPGNNGSVGAGYCPGTEDDNCLIQATDLYPYPGTGIIIDIASLGYTGNYPWVRIICPSVAGEFGDGCDIDAIDPQP